MNGPRRALDGEALALFARKGKQSDRRDPQAGEANGVKVEHPGVGGPAIGEQADLS